MAFLNCKAFDYDYRCIPADTKRNGKTLVEIFRVDTKEIVLAYVLPYSRKAWCDASATLVVLSESPEALRELQEHHGFKSFAQRFS